MHPFVPLTCEEALNIRVLSEFANSRVRLFGELKQGPDLNPDLRVLSSLGEDCLSEILIDFR